MSRAVQVVVVEPGEDGRGVSAVHRTLADGLNRVVEGDQVERVAVIAMIKARLSAAGETLKNIEHPKELRGLIGATGCWPAIRHELSDPGRWETNRVRSRPTAQDYSELDEVFVWLLWLDANTRPIIFGRMLGRSYNHLSKLDPKRRSRSVIARAYDAGILKILERLIDGQKHLIKKN